MTRPRKAPTVTIGNPDEFAVGWILGRFTLQSKAAEGSTDNKPQTDISVLVVLTLALDRAVRLALLLICLVLGYSAASRADPAAEQEQQRRQEETLDRSGEVDPGNAPQRPFDLQTHYRPLFNGALWLRAGGFLEIDALGDFGARGRPLVLAPSQLGVASNGNGTSGYIPMGVDSRLSFSRSRLYLDAYTPFPHFRHGTRAYAEIDFNGKNGPINLRQLYVSLPYLVVGRTNSVFKDPTAEPESIDSAGPNAKVGLRQQGVRLVLPVGEDALSLGWEDPGPGISPQGTDLTDDGLKRRPDLTAHYRHNADWGHLQLSAVRRDLDLADDTQSATVGDTLTGWGGALSGQLFLEGQDNLSFELAAGPGLGRYINDLAGTNSEVGVTADGQARTQFAWGGYLAYQRWLDDRTRFNTYLSAAGVQLLANEPDANFERGYKVSANLMRDMTENLRLGAEYEHGFRVSHDGSSSNGGRLGVQLRCRF